MRKFVIVLFLTLFVCTSAYGANKFGTIDMKEVMAKSESGQAAMEILRAKFEDMKKDMEKEQKAIEKLRDALQEQNIMLKQTVKEDKQLEFNRRVRDFQDMYKSYQRRIKAEEARISEPIITKLAKVIAEYGEKNKYTAIFDVRGSGLIYADKAIDVTKLIIVEFNRQSRTEGKAAKPKPKPTSE